MAKQSRSVSFKGAVINAKDMTITEYTKEDTKEYDLFSVIKSWDGIDGVSLSIKRDSNLNIDESGGDAD